MWGIIYGEAPACLLGSGCSCVVRCRRYHLYRLILQEPQQLDLQPQRDVADFVEEERASLGVFDTPLSLLCRSGKGPFFVSEQLALEQRLRNGTAVDGNKRPRSSGTLAVDRAWFMFLGFQFE